uniref:Glutaredoxin domain-containing protein n=1 Tax=viral metagenome TaxID=1070528 RepID=A0A6C0IRH0_9ZZZZ
MFPKPSTNKITIYSKSGCLNCIKVKDYLKAKNILFEVIDCDNYLLDDREAFIQFIFEISDCERTIFPIVFHGKKYIGGFNETKLHIEKMLDFEVDF